MKNATRAFENVSLRMPSNAEEVIAALTEVPCSECHAMFPPEVMQDGACEPCFNSYAQQLEEQQLAEEYEDSARRQYERHAASRYGAWNWGDGY